MSFIETIKLVENVNNLSEIQKNINQQISDLEVRQEILDSVTNDITTITTVTEQLLNGNQIYTSKNRENGSVLSISNLQKICVRINNQHQNIALRIEDKKSGLIRLEIITDSNSPNIILYYCAEKEDFIQNDESYGDHDIFFEYLILVAKTLNYETETTLETHKCKNAIVSLGQVATDTPLPIAA